MSDISIKPMVSEVDVDDMGDIIKNLCRMTHILTDGNLPTISIDDILHAESFSDDFDILESDVEFDEIDFSNADEYLEVISLAKKAIDAEEFVYCNTCDSISPMRSYCCLNCRGDDYVTLEQFEEDVKNTLPTDDQSHMDHSLESIYQIKLLNEYLIKGD